MADVVRKTTSPLTWLGRVILWIPPLTPIGVWRSLRYSRKKGERRAVAAMRKEMEKDQATALK